MLCIHLCMHWENVADMKFAAGFFHAGHDRFSDKLKVNSIIEFIYQRYI